MKKNIAVLASGKGSNAKNICSFFQNSKEVAIKLICSNKKNSPLFPFLKKTVLVFTILTQVFLISLMILSALTVNEY